jgi:hypothetical protein
LTVAVFGVGIEIVCQSLGLSHCPSTKLRTGPLAMYPLITLMWASYSFIDWRITRRFHQRGWAIVLAAVTTIGTCRDYLVAGHAFAASKVSPAAPASEHVRYNL